VKPALKIHGANFIGFEVDWWLMDVKSRGGADLRLHRFFMLNVQDIREYG
jgi:hypothetical protein